MRNGLFQGTFDPITKGHMDIIKRASKLFDKLYVLIVINKNKEPLFTLEERLEMLNKCVLGIENVVIDSYDGLTVEYAKAHDISVLVRGVRDTKDFEYERIIELYNRDLANNIETIYMANGIDMGYISSSGVRELLSYGKDVSRYVEKPALDIINKKIRR